MENPEKQVHSIVAGYNKLNKLKIYRATYSIEYESDLVYEETYNEALQSGLLNNESILDLLYNYDIWTPDDEQKFLNIPKEIEDNKLSQYENRLRTTSLKALKSSLKELRDEYSNLFARRHAYDSYTAEGVSNYAKLSFIVRTSTFYGKRLYKFRGDFEEALFEYQKNTLSEESLRTLARTESWQQYWVSLKSGVKIFENPNEEQRKLIRISTFYDNLRSSPDCPPENVIDDDDLLDGYLIHSRKEREKEENQNDLEKTLSPKVANSSEVYIVCENEEDAKKVYELNSPYARAIQESRNKVLAEKGKVNEVELPDVKKRLQMEIAKAGLN